MKTIRTLGLNSAAIAAFALLSACQSLPSNTVMLEKARRDYGAALEDRHVRELAKVELREGGMRYSLCRSTRGSGRASGTTPA